MEVKLKKHIFRVIPIKNVLIFPELASKVSRESVGV